MYVLTSIQYKLQTSSNKGPVDDVPDYKRCCLSYRYNQLYERSEGPLS
jgi:hypothetical protein